MKNHHDFIVIGSGPSGAMAAQTLVEAGADVGMIDVGYTDESYVDAIPEKDFVSIRQQDTNQHECFLGKNNEGTPLGGIRSGPQLTPPRKYVVKNVDSLL